MSVVLANKHNCQGEACGGSNPTALFFVPLLKVSDWLHDLSFLYPGSLEL